MTLVEAIVSTFVVATMLVAALHTVGASQRAKLAQAGWYRADAMARQLMAEVQQALYEEPDGVSIFGPESSERGNSRVNFDDVDDYHNWSTSPPQEKDGTPLTNGDGWGRRVAVEYVRRNNPDESGGSDEGLKRIIVTVTDPQGRQTALVSLRSSNSIYDQPPDAARTYVAWVGVELQVGDDNGGRVVLLHSYRADYPVLIVDGDVEMSFQSKSYGLSEFLLNRNLNPPGTPYDGQADNDKRDVYPNEIQGLVHVKGTLQMRRSALVRGVVLCEDSVTCKGDNQIVHVPSLYETPPLGYTTGAGRIAPQMWTRVVD